MCLQTQGLQGSYAQQYYDYKRADLLICNTVTASVCSMRRVCGISRLQKTLSLVLVLPISLATSIFAPLRHLKPIRGALLQPCIYRSAARRNKCKGTPAEKDSHVMFLQPVARELRPQHNQLQTFFCNTSQGRLQECQGYGQPRPDQTLNQLHSILCKLKRELFMGPESQVSRSEIA